MLWHTIVVADMVVQVNLGIAHVATLVSEAGTEYAIFDTDATVVC